MSRAAAAQATPNLYMVTIKNLDGTTKTVLKSQPLRGAISCYELTPDLNALWFAGQADLLGNRGLIPASIRRRIALFAAHNSTDPNSKKLVELDDEQKEQARRAALAIGTRPENFLPLNTFEALQDEDTPEIRELKIRKQIQANCSIPTHVLDAALNGEEAIVKMMLEKNAGYLLYRGTASDFSGRKYDNLTPFQAALITGDIEMAEMMKPFFDHLLNGEAEMQRQFSEIFPKGVEEHEKLQKQHAFNFSIIFAAIRSANKTDIDAALNKQNNGSALCRTLEAFRDEFTGISSNEKIFNPYHLLKAFEVYNALCEQCDANRTIGSAKQYYKKRDLFWCQIIGFCQRFMPACYAQAYVQGLYCLVKLAEAFKRDLKLSYDRGAYFPLAVDHSGLGFDVAISDGGGSACRQTPLGLLLERQFLGVAIGGVSKTFVEQKQLAIRTLCRECESSHGRRKSLV